MILTITGPSASGKTTLMRGLIAERAGIEPLESVTTRQPRESDVPGEYKYVPESWFETFLQEDAFLWYIILHGNRYGTRKQTVDLALEDTRTHVAILDFRGVHKLIWRAIAQDKRELVRSIYLYVEDEHILRARMTQRKSESPEKIEQRIAECRPWNKFARSIEHIIPFRFIDGSLPTEKVLKQTLTVLDEPIKNMRPSF
ncbi:MAG TPA: hypothetical protein VMU25_04610 [Candidatus Paceibacterota bacterium]|nr:hypothetical protein [Candidatus Paceibacterota bacterium]